MQDCAPISMTPTGTRRHFLRPRRELVLAFVLSVALHLFAWHATPYFILAWREPANVSFDAVIVPIAETPATPPPGAGRGTNRARRNSGPKEPRRAIARIPSAGFVAPANAIAVDAALETSADDIRFSAMAASDRGDPVEGPPGAPPATTLEEAIRPKSPVAIEQERANPPAPVLPSRISIAYNMSSSISDGVAEYQWTREGNRFEIDSTMQATGFMVGNFVGVLHQVSQGVVTELGLKPGSFRIRRGDGNPDSAEFLHATNELRLTRAGEVRLLPLPPLIQDMQSFLFQLSFDAPKLRSIEDRLEVLVTNARKIYRHRFVQVGIETVQVRSGAVEALHLRSDAVQPEDSYEVWLAPGKHYLPVKIKFYAGRFPVELIATSIRTTP